MERRAKQVGFFKACIEARSPYKFDSFPKDAHVAAPLVNYIRDHVVTIEMPRGMNNVELNNSLTYGTPSSEVK